MSAMTAEDFLPLLKAELRLRGVAYEPGELMAFVLCSWPWIESDPSPGRWAGEFTAAKVPA